MIGSYLASAYDADGSYDCRRGCCVVLEQELDGLLVDVVEGVIG